MMSRSGRLRIGGRLSALLAALLLLVPAAVGAGAADVASMRFTDVTEAAGIDFVQTIGDDRMTNIVESAGVGCAFLDYDGDGWLDIYLVSGHWKEGLSDPDFYEDERATDVTDRLYRSRGDGSFEDVTVVAGVDQVGFGMGVVTADYDGDGDLDIYVTNFGPNFLYRNEGDGTFVDIAVEFGVDDPRFSGGAAFLDYDRDGYLDLYVGAYVDYDPEYGYYYAPDGFPGPLAYAGEQDRLFRGGPGGRFTDVTATSGIQIEPLGRAMGVGAFDYDGDGWCDVFVSNDAMENFLLKNRGDGSFENRALQAGVAFGEAGEATAAMAVEIADFDDDGLMDIMVPDIEYSCLYRNGGQGFFEDRSAVSGIASACGQYTSWGSVFADFDLDGFTDLYISNGDVHHLEADEDLLFKGDGQGHFRDVSEFSGEWSRSKFVSRGVAKGDFDNDGDIDLLVANLDDRPMLLRNDSPRDGMHWFMLQLEGPGANRDGLGTLVEVVYDGRRRIVQRVSGGSYLSQHDARLHFGLGPVEFIDQIRVRWPDGSEQTLENVKADQLLSVRWEARTP